MLITISSKLQPEELMTKIMEQADFKGFIDVGLFAFRPFIIRRQDMKFQLRKRIYYRNPCVPIFYGEIGHAWGGAELRGVFQMHWGGQIFMPLWFLLSGLGVLGALIKVIQNGLSQVPPQVLLIPFVLLFSGFFLLKFNQAVKRDHQQIILRYLNFCAGNIESK